ncbi:uncharacterized protein LOC105220687 [Zeugodacus cucurbitae]|uniref:Lateral signaling target protein 2 homolog n=1 Tax=Zeugodacus cucurbitae TaxID=28588 RepID=A0A0A1XE99_ZEUCU|nr:uncharacterized protein LOC105220687 [Zeugodacus cucurbitae]
MYSTNNTNRISIPKIRATQNSTKMKVYEMFVSVMLSLLLLASSAFSAAVTIPNAPSEQPTPPNIYGGAAPPEAGPPSVSPIPSAAPTSTVRPLYGNTPKAS